MWRKSLGSIEFSVEHPESGADAGPSLRVSDAQGTPLLRFDCRHRSPSFQVAPKGANRRVALLPLVDNISWALAELDRNLDVYLAEAGVESSDSPDWTPQELRDLLVEAEDAMRNPPVDLDGLDLELLKTRESEKWNTYPEDVLPAWVAEMDFPLAEPIRLVLQRAADRGDTGYPIAARSTGLPEAFAARMDERFGWSVDPARVDVITDVVQGLYVSLEAYAVERSGVVVQTPIYPPFLRAVEETGRRLIDNRMVDGDDGRLHFDLDALGEQVDDDTAVVLLCNPHNPSGRSYPRRDLERLAELALARNLVVVSDEIHADLVHEGQHIPFASLGPEVERQTVTLTSATKAFNIPGLRCAVAHFGSTDLQRLYRAAHPRHVQGGLGLLGIYATLAAWRHATPWLDTVRSHLRSNRDYVVDELRQRFPDIRVFEPDATYLVWLDCRALGLDPTPATHFMRHGRVALTDGRAFGKGYAHCARINFATSRTILCEVLDRMQRALEV